MSDVSREAITRAILGQESNYGKVDTSRENYAGAIGPMQIIRPTFDSVKAKGLIPADYDFNNPEHSKAAGEALVGYLFDKYQGDPQKVAAAYYAGEKAVQADGSIKDYRDLKNAKAPSTHEYVAQVMKRMGAEGTPLTSTDTPPKSPVPSLSSWDNQMPVREMRVRGRAMREQPDPIEASPPLAYGQVVTQGQSMQEEGEGLQAEQQRADDTSLIDSAKAAFMHQGVGAILKSFVKPEYPATPGFVIDAKRFASMDEQEQEYLATAASETEAQWIEYDIKNRRDDMAAVNANGTGMGIAAQMVAGLPEGYLLGLGAYRGLQLMRVGSAALASQGRRGAALASSLIENAGVNVAVTAVQDKFDPYVGAADYAMALAMGGTVTALHVPGVFGAAGKQALADEADALAAASAQATHDVRAKALENLGSDATPEALRAEAQRLEANSVKQTVSAGTSELPENRRLLPTEEQLRPDAVTASADVPDATSPAGRVHATESPGYFYESGSPKLREHLARNDTEFMKNISDVSEGMSMKKADLLPAGVHVQPGAAATPAMAPAVRALTDLWRQFAPDAKVIVGKIEPRKPSDISPGASALGVAKGVVISAGKTHFIGLADGNAGKVLTTAVHELGHVVFHQTFPNIPKPLLERMVEEHRSFIAELRAGKATARIKRFSEGSENVLTDEGKLRGAMTDSKYTASFDEYTAEAFVRYIQRAARGDSKVPITLDKGAVALLKALWEKIKELWATARERGYLSKDVAFEEYFNRVLQGTLREAEATAPRAGAKPDVAQFDAKSFEEVTSDPVAQKHGLDLLPMQTPTQQAEAKAVLSLYKKAEDPKYKVDEARLSKLLDTAVFRGAQSAANTMLRSDNPVLRMFAAETLESPSGAAGRRSTASIAKFMEERRYLGNTLNEVQALYTKYRNDRGGNAMGDFFEGKLWQQFNREVAEEIEARSMGAMYWNSSPYVKQAADSLQASYEKMRIAQQTTKTVGWAGLPESSIGYMPHRMSPEKLRNLSVAQLKAVHQMLTDQFIQLEGFDLSFSDALASKYLDRVRKRALGGFDAPANIHQVGAADIVEEALEAMGMAKDEVRATMQRFMNAGAGHTKGRMKLDLNAEYPLEGGGTFKMMDIFETDQFRLLRTQAKRVSGEVALARHGIYGKAGLALVRRAAEFGAEGSKAAAHELESFDQVAAEFLGDSFGTQNQLVDRMMQVNSLARLGGMGFTQFAEAINGLFHVGAAKTLDAIGGMVRLRNEIKALARGEKVDNPILGSLEQYGGAEFGTDQYKIVFPFDNGALEYQTYGQDTITAADRLLRGGSWLQGKLSMWRSIHSAQQRGFAEQVVKKAAEYIKDGKSDAALRDMGIDDDLIAKMRGHIDQMAVFDANGKLQRFDITQMPDQTAAEDFVQAVHRGVSQIIQGTFTGEQSRWAHDGMMRLVTQFRTFSLTSIEKQWARQVGNVGTAKTLGMMLGAMSVAAPIYMARTYLASIGRPDQEEYLEKQLAPAQIARATLNYIALSGLGGDMLDAMTAVTGVGTVTGGRTGVGKEFIGNVVAPAAGLVDDVWRGIQNTKEGTDPHELVKALPFSRLPYVLPALNALGE